MKKILYIYNNNITNKLKEIYITAHIKDIKFIIEILINKEENILYGKIKFDLLDIEEWNIYKNLILIRIFQDIIFSWKQIWNFQGRQERFDEE